MSDDTTTSRTLALLSLLQARRSWPGGELAERLGVSGRTLRRDIERLRTLGYRVDAQRGQVGGYRLAAGSDLPPLLLSDEEAVILAVSLGVAAANGPAVGLPDTAVTVLAKVEQVLPRRLQRRVRAVRSATHALGPPAGESSPADPGILTLLALACRDQHRVRLAYRTADGTDTAREVEPLSIVAKGRRWYLICWDLSRNAWRTLRVDRIVTASTSGVAFAPRPLPGGDVAAFVHDHFAQAPLLLAEVTIAAPLAETVTYLATYAHDLRADGPRRTRWRIQAEHLHTIIAALVWLPWSYTVDGPPELHALLRDTGARMRRSAT